MPEVAVRVHLELRLFERAILFVVVVVVVSRCQVGEKKTPRPSFLLYSFQVQRKRF